MHMRTQMFQSDDIMSAVLSFRVQLKVEKDTKVDRWKWY